MRGQYEQEANNLGRRADIDLSVATKRINELEAEKAQLVRDLEQANRELEASRKLLKRSSLQLKSAASRERKLRQQLSVGENLLVRSTAAADPQPKRSRKIIEA